MARSITDIARDAIDANDDIRGSFEALISSVMGPDYANEAESLVTTEWAKTIKNKLAGSWEAGATQAENKAKSLAKSLIRDIIEPAITNMKKNKETERKDMCDAMDKSKNLVTELKNKTTTIAVTTDRQEAVNKLKENVKKMAESIEMLHECIEQTKAKTTEHTKLTIKCDTLTPEEKTKCNETKERIQDLKT